ncbi:hypothetical protein pipiens_015046 [Culex pipiens pipiens]|uniref:Uncharacterized protein n=1 Tax=Culex pipiens pipiens TaxID=38569 RepID=A0ABD1CSB4_CULPP
MRASEKRQCTQITDGPGAAPDNICPAVPSSRLRQVADVQITAQIELAPDAPMPLHMLDVLEAFLNYHGFVNLRLDETTKVNQILLLINRFN